MVDSSQAEVDEIYDPIGSHQIIDELVNVNNLTKVELQNLCKERGLNVGKKVSKVGLQSALRTYGELKRKQAVAPEDDDEGDLRPNEDENQDPVENPELPQQVNQDIREWGREECVFYRPVTNGVERQNEERKLKLELATLKFKNEKAKKGLWLKAN
ncbi:hypothetical protein NDU88_001138 [Pleurodeles waltl]|uniref:SAP domain-containing protein n=1 Tax=Pleurodeles waltl TaxID=8319 RepID=A0AAV7S9C3_PLEWA|nr:hypothetical protein NDU88_001138 [Pleurodeles waltl]